MAQGFNRFKPTRRTNLNIDSDEGSPLNYYDQGETADRHFAGVRRRWEDEQAQNRLDREREFHSGGAAAGGPAPFLTRSDPVWGPFFQALKEQGVSGVRGGNVRDSNAFSGVSAQPNYLTTGKTFMNARGGSSPNLNYRSTAIEGGPFASRDPYADSIDTIRNNALRGLYAMGARGR